MGHYHSIASAIFARLTTQRLAAELARHASRQAAHDSAASARAAKKRADKLHQIASRPRGKTEPIGHRADGRPIYRAIPAFRDRPYLAPEQRAGRADRGPLSIPGMRDHLETSNAAIPDNAIVSPRRDARADRRAARKVRMARIHHRGW